MNRHNHQLSFEHPIGPRAWRAWVLSQPPEQQYIIEEQANTLANGMFKGVGVSTSLEILWAIGRAMNRETNA